MPSVLTDGPVPCGLVPHRKRFRSSTSSDQHCLPPADYPYSFPRQPQNFHALSNTCLPSGPVACTTRVLCWGAFAAYRKRLRERYSLPPTPLCIPPTPVHDVLTHCCCLPCALCQESRELKSHGWNTCTGMPYLCLSQSLGGFTLLGSTSAFHHLFSVEHDVGGAKQSPLVVPQDSPLNCRTMPATRVTFAFVVTFLLYTSFCTVI